MANDIDYKKLTAAMIEFFTLYQSSVTKHGVKDIADELKKSDKTIYAEMGLTGLQTYIDAIQHYDDQQGKPSYLPKLGFIDVMISMQKTGDFSPFISAGTYCNMACHPMPTPKKNPMSATKCIAKITQIASKECTESFNAVIESLAGDGVVNKKEAANVSRECQEAINALYELKAIADTIKD